MLSILKNMSNVIWLNFNIVSMLYRGSASEP